MQNKDSNENILIDEINEKIGWIAGFKIDEKIINGDFAKIKISRTISNEVFELEMIKAKGRRWKVIQANQISMLKNIEFPAPNGEETTTFNWKYKGKEYSLDEKLYDSYYKFYNSLPDEIIFNGESVIEELEKKNSLFINENENDKTIKELAQSIKLLGEENNLNENQIIELVSTFVQTIPYDDKELEDINSGIFSKIDYPYEVLYKNTGICSDKSYLAYSLFKNLGYGVSFFEFPEDDHIAIGIKCPLEYSNYDSGYCFLETTSLENKIGSTPSFSKEFGIATSKIKLNDFSSDSTENEYNSLGKIEITNKIDGKTYTGIIETVAIQKEIDNLFNTVTKMDIELEAEGKDLDNQELELDRIVEKLYKLAESNNSSAYDDYDKLYSKYEKTLSDYEKDRKEFNSKIANRNQTNNKYNNLLNSFYE